MSAYELAEWQAFAELEPFGAGWDDARTGLLAALIANANRDPEKRRTPFEAADFSLLPARDGKKTDVMAKFKSIYKPE